MAVCIKYFCVLKSTPCSLAVSFIPLFQQYAHNMISTIFITVYLPHVLVFVTPSSGRLLRYLLKNCMLLAMFTIYSACYSIEMWCWRRSEKISWAYHVRNEEVLLTVKEQRNILHEISKRKANWIGNILRRNCLL